MIGVKRAGVFDCRVAALEKLLPMNSVGQGA